MNDRVTFSAADKRDAVLLEINWLKVADPEQLARKIGPGTAARQIAALEAIAEDLKVAAEAEVVRRQRLLFEEEYL